MLYSNLPVQDQKDGIWNGVMIGAAVGAGTNYGASRLLASDGYNDMMTKQANNRLDKQLARNNDSLNLPTGGVKEYTQAINDLSGVDKRKYIELRDQANEQQKVNTSKNKARTERANKINSQFDGHKGKQAAAYLIGGAALGGIIGGVTDGIL